MLDASALQQERSAHAATRETLAREQATLAEARAERDRERLLDALSAGGGPVSG